MIETIIYSVLLIALTILSYNSGKKDKCKEVQEAHNLGYSEGAEKGYINGYTKGFKEGLIEGQNEGYTQGKEEGFADGKRYGASVKYNEEALKKMGVKFGKFNNL